MTEAQASKLKLLTLSIAGLLTAVALPLYWIKVAHKAEYMDFDVYYRAATRVAERAWGEVYTLRDGTSPFRYAPALLPWFAGLAALPRDSAKLVGYLIQVLSFAGGFAALTAMLASCAHEKRGKGQEPSPLWAATCGYLLVFRLCLDTFTIGQITPVMFLFFALAGAAFVRKGGRSALSAALLLPPALLKIGPTILYGIFLSERPRKKLRAIFGAASALCALLVGSWIWLARAGAPVASLWSGWRTIVREDDHYYDASHYGSQCLKSFLLRLSHFQWISPETAHTALLLGTAVGCTAMALFWALRRPRGALGRALFFSSGLFPYFWFMPETFKYSLTPLAIPAACLVFLGSRMRKPARVGLILCLGFIALPGKDIVGDTVFFFIQRASLPFFATLILGFACFQEAFLRSRPSALARRLSRLLSRSGLEPWGRVPECSSEVHLSVLVPLPMDGTVLLPAGWLTERLGELLHFLSHSEKRGAEILLIPFGDRVSELHPLWVEALAQTDRRPDLFPNLEVRLLRQPIFEEAALSRGLALREGFLSARASKRIAFWNLEQPCDPEFFERAERLLSEGQANLVRANRRLPESRMRVPVRVLSQIYGRHRLGLLFNRLLKWALAIPTEDTHSGSLLMTRELALKIFGFQSSGNFLFDLEISLIARGTAQEAGDREASLPVTIRFVEEKGYRRLVRETLTIALSLPKLAWRERRGYYGARTRGLLSSRITADDWGISPGVNHGILELVRFGVVRRVSIMARTRFLQDGLPELLELAQKGQVELGLHYDLTFGKTRPARVLLNWMRPGAPREALAEGAQAELRSQLGTLSQHGIRPTYLDGHHHIHLIPGILEALAPALRDAGIRHVRVPYDPALWLSPRFPIAALCVRALQKVRALGFETSPCFYPEFGYFLDPGRMRTALIRHGGSEVIVHPARESDFARLGIPDDYRDPRVTEFRALRMQALLSRAESAGADS